MASVEADARERAQRRKVKTKRATEWKEKGNQEFKAGKFEKAVEYYTEGLECLKDMVVLYTNRAQAFNKLAQYNDAIGSFHLSSPKKNGILNPTSSNFDEIWYMGDS
ncbi:tetratricopeptide repeat protein 12-like [Antedon mediterranea]|uniref:tetratricopeptide repeat protein 12-like n=1 Tax=Antedon mediterranea TaxID=105859 RepID=UPI003AF59A96